MRIELPEEGSQRTAYGSLYRDFRVLLDQCDWDLDIDVGGDVGNVYVSLTDPITQQCWTSDDFD
jgi:hypothetical protein